MLDTWNILSREVQAATLYRIRTGLHNLLAPEEIELLKIRKKGFTTRPADDAELLAEPMERVLGVEFIEPRDVEIFGELSHQVVPVHVSSRRSAGGNRGVDANTFAETVGSDSNASDEALEEAEEEEDDDDVDEDEGNLALLDT